MFVRIHFDAASLFPASVIMTSIAVTLKCLRRFRRKYGAPLEWALYYFFLPPFSIEEKKRVCYSKANLPFKVECFLRKLRKFFYFSPREANRK